MTNCSLTICDYNRAIPVEGQKLWLALLLLAIWKIAMEEISLLCEDF